MTKQIEQSPIHDPEEFRQESIEALKHLATVVAEANKRLYALQIDATHSAFAENSKHLKTLLQSTVDTSAALQEWSIRLQAKMENFEKISSGWIEFVTQAFTESNELLGQSLLDFGESTRKPAARKAGIPVERRISASVIFFPERRAPASTKAPTSGSQQTTRTRNTA